jgi:GT2 family glycosyltransferase
VAALLTVGVLTRGFVSAEWAFSFRELALPNGTVCRKLPGLPFDQARNQLVKSMLRDGSPWILFLDDDVIPPPDTYDKLSSLGKEIVSGVYWKRQGKIVPAAYRKAHPNPTPIPSIVGELPVPVDYVGAGCLLVHRSVFETVKYPWFEWKLDREDLPLHERVGEDFDFCNKARSAGFQVTLHQGVRCKHTGLGWSDENGNFVPEPPAELT